MNTEQYTEFHKYVPIMDLQSTYGTPYRIQTQTSHPSKPNMEWRRTIVGSILQQPPAEGLPDDLKSISVSSVIVFMEQIINVKDVERERTQTVLRLNADDTNKVEYKVGDQVRFFIRRQDWCEGILGAGDLFGTRHIF